MGRPLLVAITGATGVIYGVELLKQLRAMGRPAHLILSEAARRTLLIETEHTVDEVKALAEVVYNNKDIGAAVASGSFLTAGMAIAPCTIKTLSAVANCYSANLVARAADVTLKEGRRLVLMVRETPLHLGHLELMRQAAAMGAVILPPMPAFYQQPRTILDQVHHSVGKVLDQFGIEHQLYRRWGGAPAAGQDPSG